jgi:hypothetical protein
MQKNDTKISNKEFTLAKRIKEEELLVARCELVYYKLRKLQIAGVEVTSLAQALDVIKDLLNKEKAAIIIIFNTKLL